MKGMPLHFEGKKVVVLQRQETAAPEFVLPFASKAVHFQHLLKKKRKSIEEPKSVLDNVNSSPSPSTSISTLSSSLDAAGGGGGGGGLAAVTGNPSVKCPQPENQETRFSNVGFLEPHHQLPEHSLDITDGEKCGDMEDWESVLSDSGQEQSILRWIMGDVEDPSMGLKKMLDGRGTLTDGELTGEFGVIHQGYLGFDSNNSVGQICNFHEIPQPPPPAAPPISGHRQNPIFTQLNPSQIPQFVVKPEFLINQNQFQSQPHQTLIPPQPKTYNPHSTQYNYPNPKPPFLNSPPINKISAIDASGGVLHYHHHQSIIDHLFKAADSIQSNNPKLAQSILARLNHHLSPTGNPFNRSAFYFKEALQLLLHSIINNLNPISSPFSLITKIDAYKSFSEVSPFLQFTNFTRNQALLESLESFDQIHIVDFDIGFGDQWASFMQEFASRDNKTRHPTIKITAFTSPTNDLLELSLTRDNLVNFAKEVNVRFDFEIVNIKVLSSVSWSSPFPIAVNLPISVFINYRTQLPLILRFVKNLSPKIVVSVDTGCERTYLPFPNHLIEALQSYTNLLESLDAVNINLQKIERFLIQPSIEKIVSERFSYPEKSRHWRAEFLSLGFCPMSFSSLTEGQALCVVKRSPVHGFHVEKRHSSLVLCWQNLELVSASAWQS